MVGKRIVYTFGLLAYASVFVSLITNYFVTLIIVPCIALTWCGIVVVSFLKDYRNFKNAIQVDKNSSWEDSGNDESTAVIHEVEPHDLEWRFETIALIGFVCLYLFALISGIIMR